MGGRVRLKEAPLKSGKVTVPSLIEQGHHESNGCPHDAAVNTSCHRRQALVSRMTALGSKLKQEDRTG